MDSNNSFYNYVMKRIMEFIISFLITAINYIKEYAWLIGIFLSVFAIFVSLFIFVIQVLIEQKVSAISNKIMQNIKETTDKTHDGVDYISKSVRGLEKSISEVKGSINEKNKRNMEAIKFQEGLPPCKIYTERPYANYSCFNYETFLLKKIDGDTLAFSNEVNNPIVKILFRFNKITGEINMGMDDIKYMIDNKKSSFRNYLDYKKFIKAMFMNSRIVFWNLLEDKVFLRTDHVLPTNLAYNDKQDSYIELFQKIVRIENHFGEQFQFRKSVSKEEIKIIYYINDVLDGKSINLGKTYSKILQDNKDKDLFLKHTWYLGSDKTGYRYQEENEQINLFGKNIELGSYTIDFPFETKMTPSLEEIKKQTSFPINIKYEVQNDTENIKMHHNVLFRKDNIE